MNAPSMRDQITSGLAHRADNQGEADQHRHGGDHQLGHGRAVGTGLGQHFLGSFVEQRFGEGDVGHGQADGGDGSVAEQGFHFFHDWNLINYALCAWRK
ncbi:hypothetical protein HMPREF3150_06196 [Pseudomonas aeruginosa]|nr:hypothetical protein HMPREF3150_06196 [Pseudomonas aeruginosa]